MPAPEPMIDADAITFDVPRPPGPPLADGSDTYELESLAGVAEPTHELDAILLVDLRDHDHADAPTGAKAERILYIVDSSTSCIEAKRQLDRIHSEYVEGDLRLTIRNLSQVPLDQMDTRILAVPTLVLRARRDLRTADDMADAALFDILAACGARRGSGC